MFARQAGTVLRWFLFVLIVAVAIGWISNGHHIVNRILVSLSPPLEEEVNRIVAKLESEDPEAAAELTRLREDRETKLATEAVILDSHRRGGTHSLFRFDHEGEAKTLPYQIRLALLAADPNLIATSTDREAFLWAHGTALELLEADARAANDYFAHLDRATKNPELWRMANDNAMALLICDLLTDKDVRDYFEQEQEWLDEVLVQLMGLTEMTVRDKKEFLAYAVELSYRYRPYIKQAVVDHELDATAFLLFHDHGDVIVRAVSGGAPLDEVLDVVFANSDHLEGTCPVNAILRPVVIWSDQSSIASGGNHGSRFVVAACVAKADATAGA